jgi:hypothetical protein
MVIAAQALPGEPLMHGGIPGVVPLVVILGEVKLLGGRRSVPFSYQNSDS